jgi:DNA recombination protein RmuC
MAQNAEEICALGKELYSRIVTMTSNLDDLRKKLDGSVQAYNKVIGSFEGRVLVQARKLRDLGAATGDEIAPLDAIDTAPRVLQSANLLGLPEEATIDAETLEATLVEQERVG